MDKGLIQLNMIRFRKFFIISLIVSIVLVFYLVSQSLPFESTETYDEPYNLQKNENLHYMIVIDAGSTGSRIHVFKLFHDETLSSKKFDIKLLNEVLFVKTKPGLSSFANEPEKAIQTIQPLLNRAFEIIPNEYRRRARVSLKATAGLRMISKKASQIILESIDKLFDEYPFISDSKDLGILDGKYEGIYSWVTLNYALKTFEISGESETCSLDLGGGSTQITFIPSGIVTGQEKDYLVDFLVDKTRYSIYAKSFLGYGLMSARMNMFNHDLHNSLNRTELGGLSSVCVPHGTRFKWFQQGIEYTVNGARSKELNTFENCFKIALKTLTNNIKAPVELKDKRIYAFSFYYDRLKSANLLEITNVLKLSEIQKKAAEICNKSGSSLIGLDKEDKDYPFLCMDLTFIYVILSEGFKLPDTKEIIISNKVNQIEINWALGAAFHMLSN